MRHLSQILKHLSKKETELVEYFYKNQKGLNNSKRYELLKLCQSHTDLTDEEASIKIYKKPPHSAYSHLKKRVRDDLLNILLLEDSSRRIYDKRSHTRAELECSKKMIQGVILHRRGAYEAAKKILLEVAELAERYELFTEQIKVFDFLSTTLGVSEGVEKFQTYRKTIIEKVDLLKKTMRSREQLYTIGLPQIFDNYKTHQYENYALNIIKEMENDLRQTNSDKMKFYYENARSTAYLLLKKYDLALESADKMLDIVTKSLSVKSKGNIGGAHYSRAVCLIHLREYEMAEKDLFIALNNFSKKSKNRFILQRLLFNIYMTKADLPASESMLEVMVGNESYKVSKFNTSLLYYFRACLLFLQRNYKKTISELNKCSFLISHKSSWAIGVRYMELLLSLEDQFDYERSYSRLLSLKTIMKQQEYRGHTRIKWIVEICDHLIANQCRFKFTAEKKKDKTDDLLKSTNELYWDPIGFEIIRFDKWFNQNLEEGNQFLK